MHTISVTRKIQSPCEHVRPRLWAIKDWVQFWSPLHRVDVLYDDGLHQDFSLFLEWQTKETCVRTVRFLDCKGDIAFFSPTPPEPMSIHHGLWHFVADGTQATELTAIRWFLLPYMKGETVQEYQKRLDSFSGDFIGRLEKLLKCFGELCEKPM